MPRQKCAIVRQSITAGLGRSCHCMYVRAKFKSPGYINYEQDRSCPLFAPPGPLNARLFGARLFQTSGCRLDGSCVIESYKAAHMIQQDDLQQSAEAPISVDGSFDRLLLQSLGTVPSAAMLARIEHGRPTPRHSSPGTVQS